MSDRVLTEDGPTIEIEAAIVTFLITGDLGGGTIELQRLIDGGDRNNDDDWILIQDADEAAVFTEAPSGGNYDLGGFTDVRGFLTGSTGANLEYHLRGRYYFGHE